MIGTVKVLQQLQAHKKTSFSLADKQLLLFAHKGVVQPHCNVNQTHPIKICFAAICVLRERTKLRLIENPRRVPPVILSSRLNNFVSFC